MYSDAGLLFDRKARRMPETLSLAVANLTSAPVLAFALGVLAALLNTKLNLPAAVYQGLSMFLLLAIGLKGGVALRSANITDLLGPVALAIVLGVLIPFVAFGILKLISTLSAIDRGSIAAHYGSTSLVTFTAALVFVESAGIVAEGYLSTLLVVLEIPGIIVGLALAQRASAEKTSRKSILTEVLLGRSILLLAGGLAIGAATGPVGYAQVEPFFAGIFAGVLTLFLLEMGTQAGTSLKTSDRVGWKLVSFAVLFPLAVGTVSTALASMIGMSVGGAAIFGVLCASASYIAAPAAVQLSLPKANTGLSLTMSLGITFPVNLILGIPLYVSLAVLLG